MFIVGDLNCIGAILSNSIGLTGSFFVFNGAGTKTISSTAPLRGLQLGNAALDLTLGQSLTVQAGVNLANGKLVLGNYNLTLLPTANIGAGSASSYVVTNGTGKFFRTVTTAADTFPIGTTTTFNRVTLATETASDIFGIRILSTVNPSSTKDSATIQRTIDIARTTTDSLNFLTLTFR